MKKGRDGNINTSSRTDDYDIMKRAAYQGIKFGLARRLRKGAPVNMAANVEVWIFDEGRAAEETPH